MSEQFDQVCEQIKALAPFEAVTPFDILSLPSPLRGALNRAYRAGEVKLSELAGNLMLTPAETLQVIPLLLEKGLLREIPEQKGEPDPLFETHYFGRMRGGTSHVI